MKQVHRDGLYYDSIGEGLQSSRRRNVPFFCLRAG